MYREAPPKQSTRESFNFGTKLMYSCYKHYTRFDILN